MITHPPSHYLPAHVQSNNIGGQHFDDDFDVKNDADSNEYDNEDNDNTGFFEVPPGFPSLDALGAGFESMKIRHKRAALDLDAGEQRYRRRHFSDAPFTRNRHRRQGPMQ